jgi:splicing factor 3B subunit 1
MGCAVLPHLKNLVDIIEHGLKDEEQKVRTITALAISALAEASNPYGIEAFDTILIPLWDGISMYRGKSLAAFLKAIGFIIPLMDSEHAGEYTKFVTPVLIREFQNNDDEMKKIVLKVVKQCVSSEGVSVAYVRDEIIPEFFRNFWVRRNALDKKNYKQLIETSVEIAGKVGGAEIIKKIVDELKDENESYRKIVMETIERIVATYGVADINSKLEEKLMDGILFAFQEQASEDTQIVLNAFGTIVNCLGVRTKPHVPRICGTIQWRMNHRSAKVRQQAADLI